MPQSSTAKKEETPPQKEVDKTAEGPDEAKARSLRTLISDEQLEQWKELKPALSELLAGLEKEQFPKAKDDLITPEEAIRQALEESISCSGQQATAATEARVQEIKRFLASPAVKDASGSEVASMKEMLAKEEAHLVKASKSTPSLELELKGLQAAQSRFIEKMQLREDRVRQVAEAGEKRRQVPSKNAWKKWPIPQYVMRSGKTHTITWLPAQSKTSCWYDPIQMSLLNLKIIKWV